MKEEDIPVSELFKWPVNPRTFDLFKHVEKISYHQITRHTDTEAEKFVFTVCKKYTPLFTLGVLNRLHEVVRRFYKKVILVEIKLPENEIIIKKILRKRKYVPKMGKKEIYKTSSKGGDVYMSIS